MVDVRCCVNRQKRADILYPRLRVFASSAKPILSITTISEVSSLIICFTGSISFDTHREKVSIRQSTTLQDTRIILQHVLALHILDYSLKYQCSLL